MGLTVRPYDDSRDREALVRMVAERVDAMPFPDPMDHDVHCALVAESNGQIVGFIAGQTELQIHMILDDKTSHITKGRAAKALVADIQTTAWGAGFRVLVGSVMPRAKRWAEQLMRLGIQFDDRYHFEVTHG